MEEFLKKIRGKLIHIVGVTGAEGSSILRFLISQKIKNITTHDFADYNALEKSYKLWHKGISIDERNKLFKQFTQDLSATIFYSGEKYLKDILSADIIFVSQSWRLYKQQNQLLWEAKNKNTPFYSLTRLYLDFAKAKVVGVTGTVGKGSTANILVQFLKAANKNVYFAGNESWMVQVLDKFAEMTNEDILVLEISHRQLQDGFAKAPDVVIFTNLYPNHLDEVTWDEYKKLKLSLITRQTVKDIAILNYGVNELRNIIGQLKSKIIFYSEKKRKMNIKSIQDIYEKIVINNSTQYIDNILAASTAANLLGVSSTTIAKSVKNIQALSARMEFIKKISGVSFYNDIKSTTPWATLAAVKKLAGNCILICGGRTKGIDYQDFIHKIEKDVEFIILLKSELSDKLIGLLPEKSYAVFTDLESAVLSAQKRAQKGKNILVSPAAGFFYSDFVKGKKSLRRIVEDLPQS